MPQENPGEFVSDSDPEPQGLPVNLLYLTEATRDTHLEELMRVLELVHERFFRDPSLDVVTLFAQVRREVLAGCVIVMSGVYATNTRKEQRWLEILAQDFGATVKDEVVPGTTTHVVAVQTGTQKVIWRRKESYSFFKKVPKGQVCNICWNHGGECGLAHPVDTALQANGRKFVSGPSV